MIKNFQNNIRAIYTTLISYVGGQFKRIRENRLRVGEQIRGVLERFYSKSRIIGKFKEKQSKFNLGDLDTNERNEIMATIKEVASEFGEKIIDLGTKVVIIDVIQSDINRLVETKTKKKLSVETKLKIVDEIETYLKSKKQLIIESEDYDMLINLVNELKNRIKDGK
jgi:hypothetical protein